MAYFFYATKEALNRQMNSASTDEGPTRAKGACLEPALLFDFQDLCSASDILNVNRPAVSAIWLITRVCGAWCDEGMSALVIGRIGEA